MDDRPEAGRTDELLGRVAAGDAAALDELMAGVRPFMHRVVEVRMDPRLRARIDPSDVVQETLVEATRRIRDFLDRRPLPFHLWVRQMAFENLIRLRRFHVGAGKPPSAASSTCPRTRPWRWAARCSPAGPARSRG